ncbi:MAG TPA: helix-turn-helix domain-containing protein [Actinophytocola sp.]|uniref:PucR family transcriptional regulator n=1 Tax=Actinophytocola sp. TaxID=1872138 RepID=UPI002DDCA4CF|nr:helix-turn-helix domain-containing protein [Actinophytocola sp.]HEV2779308.1 helix-turn-helix domain-containing protein [Actinophytocola sp.]
MSDDLQRVVDELALNLGRPVLLEDHLQRVVAYSEQTEPMDDVRRESILRRHTTPEVLQWLRAAGIFDSQGALRIPAAPELGLLPRVCVPARYDGRLLGFLWLIDSDPPMSEEDVRIAAKTAPGLALSLFHNSLVAGLAASRELEAVTALLLGDREAARTLIETGDFPHREPVTVLVARPVGEPDENARLAMERGLLAARSRFASRHPLHLVRHDHGVLLLAGKPVDLRAGMSVPVVVGIGRPRPALADAAESYREALHAADVAARIPGFGPSAEWAKLGVYRMLSLVPGGELHAGVERLLADRQHLPLLETLETYLDLAGSAVATARALRLHRTSLYYRLQRVEQLAETDLRNGDERLALHLSLKLARLSGRYRPRLPTAAR